METKKQNIIIITVSVIISASILLTAWIRHDPQRFERRVYVVTGGWGYDILVDKKLFIRQVSIPVVQDIHPFPTKEEADQTAQLVIKKLEAGKLPTLTKADMDQVIVQVRNTK